MKIVQINTFPHKATGMIMFNIHKSLKELGYNSYVIWGRGRDPQNESEYSIYDSNGIKLHGIGTRLFDKTSFLSWSATKKLISILDEINPDIVHVHNLHGYYLNIEMLFNYFKKNKVNVVWTLHDCWALTGHCAYFSAIECSKWKTGCNKCPQKKTYPISIGLDNSRWNWNKKNELYQDLKLNIVTVSKWLMNIVNDSMLSKYPCRTIYNGLDLDIFKYRKSQIRTTLGLENKFIILGVASEWTERKGLDDFIKLSKKLSNSYQIILIGLTQKQINLIKDTPILGFERTSSINELVEFYSEADVFLNLSVEETMGMTTIEAMACGTPVVVYNCTALPEILSDFPEHIVNAHDILGLINVIDKIRMFKKDTNIYRNIALKYNYVNKNQEYIKLYESIVKGD